MTSFNMEMKTLKTNNKINIGIVGLHFGTAILRQIREQEAGQYINLCAVCDLDRERADEIAHECGVKAYYNLDDLLDDPEITAVGLFTGPGNRAQLLRKIIRSGRDVVTTKPFEIDPEEATSVLQEARELGRIIHLNSPAPLLNRDMRIIKNWRGKYQLGRPVAFHYSVWKSIREEPNGSWYDDVERCPAAPVFRIGIYLINDLVSIFGEAESVNVITSRLFTGRPTSDNAQLGIKFKNGAIGTVFASFCVLDNQYAVNKLILNYENGTIYKNIWPFHSTGSGKNDEPNLILDRAHKPLVKEKFKGHDGRYQWDVFHRMVNGEKVDVDVSPEDIVESVKIVNAMKRAVMSGRTETV